MERSKDIRLEDQESLTDRLLQSLHRNIDGHLSADKRNHPSSVDRSHNVCIIYFYTRDSISDFHFLHSHYAYSADSLDYSGWYSIVEKELTAISKNKPKGFLGFYGWLTSRVQVTPLRTGDLFIKIDKTGANGVRLSFGPRKTQRQTHNEKEPKKAGNRSNRVR